MQSFTGAEQLGLARVRQYEVFDCMQDFACMERPRMDRVRQYEVFDCTQDFACMERPRMDGVRQQVKDANAFDLAPVLAAAGGAEADVAEGIAWQRQDGVQQVKDAN